MNALSYFRRKPAEVILHEETGDLKQGLKRRLGAFDLTTMGIGAIIGTGIFVLTGVAASRYAGPAAVLSFVLAGAASALAALVYTELAAMVPVAGSAYTYSYAAMGEIIAWIIGWDLILEYTVAAGAVAIGWSGYLTNLLQAAGLTLPASLSAPPALGGIINFPAVAIVALIAGLLILGTKESAMVNNIIVLVKLGVILLFIAVGATHLNPKLWTPFLPFGWPGVVAGAAIIFFAYIGFDAVSTAAEEVRNPARDLPLGILGSLGISSLLYILVALVVTGMVSYRLLNVPSPLSFALLRAGVPWAAAAISVGAITGLGSVILVDIFGQSRIFFAMARDGLLPQGLSRLHPRYGTPYVIIVMTALMVAAIGGFLPVALVAELANIGTLTAFVLVSLGVIVLRHTQPALPRPFKVPFFPVVPLLSAAASVYLILNLPRLTWLRFVIWLAVGMVLYFSYGSRHSRLAGGEGVSLPNVWLPAPARKELSSEEPGPAQTGLTSADNDHEPFREKEEDH
ncbi:MAG: amino acid permease [Clostridia bacterium]|nr:MAG: amino acid permease [Clostridia bacterium]